MPLSDTAIRNAKSNGDKAFKLSDEKGLYLLITPSGGKWWRLDYRFYGKRKTVSMGTYPETSLKEARDKRDQARKQLAQGIDPGENRKAMKAAQSADGETLEMIAREWHSKFSPNWTPEHGERILRRMEADIFPWLGKATDTRDNRARIAGLLA